VPVATLLFALVEEAAVASVDGLLSVGAVVLPTIGLAVTALRDSTFEAVPVVASTPFVLEASLCSSAAGAGLSHSHEMAWSMSVP